MDVYIRSIAARMSRMIYSAIIAKWLFIAAAAGAYLYAGHAAGAVLVAGIAFFYDFGQAKITDGSHLEAAVGLGLCLIFSILYLHANGPVWHLFIVISVMFGLRCLRQHGFEYHKDIEVLTRKRSELREEDVEGKSEICVRAGNGRQYAFKWDRKEVEDLLREKDEETVCENSEGTQTEVEI